MADLPIVRTNSTRRTPPKIDFTPMVDLGFLLITFFMLSTSLAKPRIMPVVMPDAEGQPQPTKASTALTLLLGADDRISWYEGIAADQLHTTDFSPAGLRQVLLDKMARLQTQFGLQTYQDAGASKQGSFLNVLIKPCPESRYKNLVDALDEMNICQVRYYCILDPNASELATMSKE